MSKEREHIAGWKTMTDGRRLPITRSEADVMLAQIDANEARKVALMPDEKSAIQMMSDAFDRLQQLGWREAIYCPKDGSSFEVIEPGSTGIFRCRYAGEWPDGSWWIEEDGGTPSRPVLFRLLPEAQAEYDAKMVALRKKYRADRAEDGE